jgi:hypothetical protein
MKHALLDMFQRGVKVLADIHGTAAGVLGRRAAVGLSVANIRYKPDHAAEMGTQAPLGTVRS